MTRQTTATTVDMRDADALASWCVFWSDMPGGPAQGALAAKVLRLQKAEIERLRAACQAVADKLRGMTETDSVGRPIEWMEWRLRDALGQEVE